MVGNISDVYYLLQLILPEVYVYIRDTVLHEFPWPGESNNDDMDNLESTCNNIPKHISSDLITLPFICVLSFIILIIFEKFFKNDNNLYASGTNISIPNDLPMVYANSRITDTLHSCGDTFFSQEILQSSNSSLQSMCMKSQRSKNLNLPGSSIAKVHSEDLHHSQSTQTNLRILNKAAKSEEWVVRRTRSGQIYGKYPSFRTHQYKVLHSRYSVPRGIDIGFKSKRN
ncbi:uncharacterized protein LOC124425812 isoform X1 [Vespa crabro]|uniref:uncharacterized protein LOC124425812 isoform X1 n=1 Tax=Vespa crabro TaxID=7445 RepID=UPI001F02BE6F|nr:uncharacterized protein LOC124425812 isoform X1 [Vespa crabro]